MITKNYYRYLAYLFSNNSAIKVKNYFGNDISTSSRHVDTVGWGIDTEGSWGASMGYIRNTLTSNPGVILGDGDTPPTSDDYKLAGNLVSGFTYSKTLKQVASDTAVTVKAVYTITNTNSTAITIKEIGLIGAPTTSPSASTSKTLFDRTVLDTPVTIPAGGVGQVEYTITFNLPTAAADTEETN